LIDFQDLHIIQMDHPDLPVVVALQIYRDQPANILYPAFDSSGHYYVNDWFETTLSIATPVQSRTTWRDPSAAAVWFAAHQTYQHDISKLESEIEAFQRAGYEITVLEYE